MAVSPLILPGDPLFDETLGASLPPGWEETAAQHGEQCAYVADHETGILRPASWDEMIDYMEGGEYEARLKALGDDDMLAEFYGEYA
jgi:hypothetical protein